MKLDLRIIVNSMTKTINASNREMARAKVASSSKHYNDKCKAVLAAKCHLNSIVKSIRNLPTRLIKITYIPVIQIIGLNRHVCLLSLIDQNLYVVEKVIEINYPRTYHEPSQSGIKI